MREHSLFSGFPRGDPNEPEGQPPAEKFQAEMAVKNAPALQFTAANPEGKIFLGLVGATVVIDAKQPRLFDGRTNRYAVGGTPIGVGDDRHVGTIAGSRSGKGRACLVDNLLVYPGSCLVVDPKGELALLTANQRRRLGHDVHILDPYAATGQPSLTQFNSLDTLVESDDLLADAGLIGDALVMPTAGNKDPHWDDSAKQIIEGLILHVGTADAFKGKRNLIEVYNLLWRLNLPAAPGVDIGSSRFGLENEMMANVAANGAVRHAARDFYDRADRERASVLSTARRHLHFIGYEKLQKTLKSSSFDLRDLKRKRMTVYLSLPAMRMGTCSRWLRLFVNLTLSAMEQERARPEHPVLLVLDEFATLGPMAAVENAAGQIAGFGCRLWFILQDLNQLKSLYSERWETFLGNAGVLQFFGNSDLTTLEWVSRRLGTTSAVNVSQGQVAYNDAASGRTGESWSIGTVPLMTPAEIARFFGRDDEQLRQLIIRPTVPPIVLQRAFYDKHELFRGMFTALPETAGQKGKT